MRLRYNPKLESDRVEMLAESAVDPAIKHSWFLRGVH